MFTAVKSKILKGKDVQWRDSSLNRQEMALPVLFHDSRSDMGVQRKYKTLTIYIPKYFMHLLYFCLSSACVNQSTRKF